MQRNIDRFERTEFNSSDADLLGPEIRRWREAMRKGEAPRVGNHVREFEIRL
jgi:hypothetical protein